MKKEKFHTKSLAFYFYLEKKYNVQVNILNFLTKDVIWAFKKILI